MARKPDVSDPLKIAFNDYRIRQLGKRLKNLRLQERRIAQEILATQEELSERSAARKEASNG